MQVFSEQNMEFMEKIIERSGLGDETGLSDGILAMRDPDAKLGTTLKAATEETQMVIFEVAANLLKKTGVRPDQARSLPAGSGLRRKLVCAQAQAEARVEVAEPGEPPEEDRFLA